MEADRFHAELLWDPHVSQAPCILRNNYPPILVVESLKIENSRKFWLIRCLSGVTRLMGKNEATDVAKKVGELKITTLEGSKGAGLSSVEKVINTSSNAHEEGNKDHEDQAQSQVASAGKFQQWINVMDLSRNSVVITTRNNFLASRPKQDCVLKL